MNSRTGNKGYVIETIEDMVLDLIEKKGRAVTVSEDIAISSEIKGLRRALELVKGITE